MASLFEQIASFLSTDDENEEDNQDNVNSNVLSIEDKIIPDFYPTNSKTVNIRGKEMNVYGEVDGESDGEVYMGEWARQLIYTEKQAKNPDIYVGYGTLGASDVIPLGYPRSGFNTHTYISGQTGAGKSTMIINMLIQFYLYGNNFTLLTPKKDDVIKVIQSLPEEELEKTDIVRPGDTNISTTIGYNLFNFPVPLERIRNIYEENDNVEDDKQYQQVMQLLESRVDTFKAIMTSQYGSGARIGPIIENLSYVMMMSDKNYTLADFINIVTNADRFQEFLNDINNEMGELPVSYLEKIENYDEDDLAPVANRFSSLELSEAFRQMFFKQKSDIDFEDYVSGDRNLIFDMSLFNSSKEKIAFYGILFIRELWFEAQRREERTTQSERDLVPVFIDEFQHIVTEDNYESSQLGDILQQARQFEMGLIAASQDPNQIDDAPWEEFVNNVTTKIPLKTNNQTRAMRNYFNNSASQFKVKQGDIGNLADYTSFNQVGDDGEIIKTNNFGRFPPLRTEDEARKIRNNIMEATGSKAVPKRNADFLSIVGGKRGEEESTEDKDTETEEHRWRFCRATDIAQRYYYHQNINSDLPVYDDQPKTEYVDKDIIIDIMKEWGYDYGYAEFDQFRENNQVLFDTLKTEDALYIGLSSEGEKLAHKQDSGSSGSGGKSGHRDMLMRAREELAKHGIAVTVPQQEGDEKSDGLGYKFVDDIPPAAEKLFNNVEQEISYMEAESTTSTSKPGQTVKNLAKIKEQGYKCVFIFRNFSDAQSNEQRMLETNGYSKVYDSGEKLLFNASTELSKKTAKGQIYPVRPAETTTARTYWVAREINGETRYVMKDSEKREHAHLTLDALANDNWEKEDFPAYVYKKNDQYIVYDSEENEVIGKYDTQNKLKSDWRKIKQPFIPEYLFNMTGYPTRNDFTNLVIEYDDATGEKGEVYIYEDGEKYYFEEESESKTKTDTDVEKVSKPTIGGNNEEDTSTTETNTENTKDKPQKPTEDKSDWTDDYKTDEENEENKENKDNNTEDWKDKL